MTRRGERKRRLTAAGLLWWLARRWWLVALLAALVVTGGLIRSCKRGETSVSLTHTTAIDTTPEEITALRDIGQWELLTISTEELIDTVATGWTGVRQLVRIYTGTLRIGIDLGEASENWVTVSGDTLRAVLPKVKLLDDDFIDEAQTQSFFESGTWNGKAREDLYQRAKAKMKKRCLTKENLESAEDNASKQFYQMFKAMGFNTVEIRFEK